MVNVCTVGDSQTWSQFIIWSIIVFGTSKAIFRSFPTAEIFFRWQQKTFVLREEESKIRWELQTGFKWDPHLARTQDKTDDLKSMDKLSIDDKDRCIKRLHEIARKSTPHRAYNYWLHCLFCQAFQVSLVLYWFLTGWGGSIASSFAYAVMCILLSKWVGADMESTVQQGNKRKPGNQPCPHGDCGK